jgi:hypothetical protein
MKMSKDTVRALIDSDIISKNVAMSEPYYWVFEQVNSEIDLMVLDDDTLLYVTKIVCDDDVYEIHTNDSIFDFDADNLVLKANGTGQIVSWNLYAENNIDFVNYSKVL